MTGGPPYYLTTPIFYVNDAPHLGHAYAMVAADALARFMRLDGRPVHFLTGTDEHGQKVEKSARAAGIDPQSFCDRVSQNFREVARLMNISNDDFIRTTEPRHIRACQALWRAIAANRTPKGRDNIYLGKYSGWYAVRDEAFYDEDELAVDADGKRRALSGAEVEWVEEPSYFFRLSDWQDWLLDHYERHPDFIGPAARRNEVVSFVRSGLRDLSISRTSFSWGIPVPGDEKHVMYVWLDALANYITAIDYPDVESAAFKTFWPAALHLIGKDIIRFHCVYWPAFLAAAGLAMPQRIFGTGWLLSGGEKMSKSLGNVVRSQDLVEQYGLDPVRYYLLREVPFGSDGYISEATIIGRINGDLANDLGNLAQRVLSMIQRYCDGKIPPHRQRETVDSELNYEVHMLIGILRKEFAAQAFHRALEAIWRVIGLANRYVDAQAPWTLRKTNPERMEEVLYWLAETLRHLAVYVWPIMPGAADKLLDQLAVSRDPKQRSIDALDGFPLVAGTALPKPEGIFPRYVEAEQAAT